MRCATECLNLQRDGTWILEVNRIASCHLASNIPCEPEEDRNRSTIGVMLITGTRQHEQCSQTCAYDMHETTRYGYGALIALPMSVILVRFMHRTNAHDPKRMNQRDILNHDDTRGSNQHRLHLKIRPEILHP